MVLGKFSVPGHPTNLENNRARAYALAVHVGAGGVCLDIFFSRISFLFSFSLFGRWPDIDRNSVTN